MNHRIARAIATFLLFAASVAAADITGIWTGQQ